MKIMPRIVGSLILLVSACLLLSGCGTRQAAVPAFKARTFAGVLDVPEPVELSSDAHVRINLVTISRSGGQPAVIATQQMTTRGRQFPIPFQISVDEALIRPDERYALLVAVAVGGQLRFIAQPPAPLDASQPQSNLRILLSPPRALR